MIENINNFLNKYFIGRFVSTSLFMINASSVFILYAIISNMQINSSPYGIGIFLIVSFSIYMFSKLSDLKYLNNSLKTFIVLFNILLFITALTLSFYNNETRSLTNNLIRMNVYIYVYALIIKFRINKERS